MSRELLILRHGKSDWAVAADDFNRPLKGRGIRGARKIGLWMKRNAYFPDCVISSPAKRAISTAKIICNEMEVDEHIVSEDERVYMASPKELLGVIQKCPANINRLVVVGHNPGLELLTIKFAKHEVEIPEDGKLLPTSSLAIFDVESEWKEISKKQTHLIDIVRARDLSDEMFKFDNTSSELA